MKNKLLSIIVVLLMLGLGASSCDTIKPPPHPKGLKQPPAPGSRPPAPPSR